MGPETATNVLEAAGVSFELLPHAPTESALAEAGALGVSTQEVAKTVVLTTPGGYVRAVLPASERLDLHKVRELVGNGTPVHLAGEDDLARDYAEFDLGAIPPFAGRREPVVVDRHLVERASVVLEAGSKTDSVRLQTADLVRLTAARVGDICEE